ncbi:MAG: hypothetical protein BGO69_09960 [Bacteroidetes bacterium 46-16]|nr:MAG: hypothetical protein BGO69_09960 [Bacteroidetes bacterium 46-16]
MENIISTYLENVEKDGTGISGQVLEQVLNSLDFKLPTDYLGVMSEFETAEGPIGKNRWLTLFPLKDLRVINERYISLMSAIPDYFLFGKDAADTAYAFHKIYHTFHGFGFMSDFDTDNIEYYGNSFEQFLRRLYEA